MMEIFYNFSHNWNSQKPHLVIKHLKCVEYNWEAELDILFNFNQAQVEKSH